MLRGSLRLEAARGSIQNMKQTIYIVEDDSDICRLVRVNLEAAGYATECFASGRPALARAAEHTPSLLLLDIMLPGEDGLSICRRIRTSPRLSAVPIIFMTARVGEDDRILGLEIGGDDYITKPFSPRELVARVKAALRRTSRPRSGVIRFGNVEVNLLGMVLKVAGEEKSTTTMEFRILEALVSSPGRVLSRDRLLHEAGAGARDITPRAIDVYIRRIREKIEAHPDAPVYIKTIRGAGYRFSVTDLS